MLGTILRSLTNPAEAETALLELGNARVLERVRADAQADGTMSRGVRRQGGCAVRMITQGRKSGWAFSALWRARRSRVPPRSGVYSPKPCKSRARFCSSDEAMSASKRLRQKCYIGPRTLTMIYFALRSSIRRRTFSDGSPLIRSTRRAVDRGN
jgi:hypothetical protein